ncbi:UDP-N-acetylglucosamine--N-acetylmuramyl-(pentapeptide) pyrophosphoryl-undecaprenol N-acetylglucosamine transferase [Deinococcus metalli]|uniref:UDP-N-acetylglucosamine--N-acetylmuramyl-(pentapeptide) pyrophosphoryl-undecaprenol N-acetylglucosamine transferase n=1 Tax=Deinococcus metalli TaxID=1141878 RepID=A0A7W8NPB4_9DEIO|nr:undecaprenyldiphospho-muramoylpentapeptide beta-N-acetylglucosaminyltransferase [Deinococcus metalli]MBB5374658.1 UDP-N-acetylglucosamine--N-acetylmuramyl-(pentapeptide) pyrophosphoryl-undecaprenol N-acetylglucosamine transferase [Deinococcus metalli]GHF34665.1 UDP-N-acetylglucosamine--N-acetylmuramyl-(pentapeptide) pyrophosphoryl-undecaprenol N-acetylglucosamine transferase [Deinococcus metalli]
MTLVVLATGGTGGHIYPAVATARALMARGHDTLLLGQRGGMEERVAAEQGLAFQGVEAGKLARSGQGRADPRELLRAGAGVFQARALLARLRPGGVVGFGGFASLPGVLAAQALGIPTVLHEQNARLGLTQRLAVRGARAVGTAYPEVVGLDPRKATLVGMPVREERLGRTEALSRLGLQDGPLTILVMGGSQGSLFLNNAVPDTLRNIFGGEGLVDHALGVMTPRIDLDFGHTPGERTPDLGAGVQVLHATGRRWLNDVAPRVREVDWYHVSGYVDAVAAWSAADLAITRGGTGTLAEAAYHGVPLVMVPLPESAENHQWHNAMTVQRAGAGRVVEQASVGEALGSAVLECAAAGTRIAMRAAALKRSQPGAAERFADLVERHLRGGSAAP